MSAIWGGWIKVCEELHSRGEKLTTLWHRCVIFISYSALSCGILLNPIWREHYGCADINGGMIDANAYPTTIRRERILVNRSSLTLRVRAT
jgi:hypothetical protein